MSTKKRKVDSECRVFQRWSRGHKARGQGHKKNPRPRTALPRTDPLEVKDQGHSRKRFPQKKKVFKKFFWAISKRGKRKRCSQIFREVYGVFLHNFKNEQIPTIIGTDSNAHHIILGFSDINSRGEDLLAYCVSADLHFCNLGNKPTFRTKTREEVLDLTVVRVTE